ncbi:MAG: efflux transporter outer membrane subunit [Gemmatimonadetes bacterium]|nr:efflux transporter outer membrane subunit [Gemmatimonadota bacterium]
MTGVCRSLLAILFVCGSLSACSPHFRAEDVPLTLPDDFSGAGIEKLPERWWTAFGDSTLNAAVDSSLSANFDLLTAWYRLQSARALAARESGDRFPDIDAFADAESRESSEESREGKDFQAGLAAEYEIDLWGRVRSRADAERYRAGASRADYQAAALSLSAEIVTTWYRLAEAYSQFALVEEQIETNETVLTLLKNRFGTGQVRGVDILRQKRLVAARREQRGYALSRIAVLENRLDALTGRAPGSREHRAPVADLPELPPLPETGVPVDLVRRRPDIQRAFLMVRAADSDLAAAMSDRYPRLTLSVSAASLANQADKLFEEWVTSFAGNLLAPIFRGGELQAEVDRTGALRQQRVYEYGQAVLVAFHEVEDALVLERNQLRSLESIGEQVDLSEQAYGRLRAEYFNGTSNYLDVLTALDEVQRLRQDRLAARLTLVEYRVSLYRALAGSFETPVEMGGVTQ